MIKKDLLSIGEVSKLKGITIKALRFYEKIGLLKPEHIDPTTKYRYYSANQFLYLDIIKALRSMGVSPQDIRVMLEKQDTSVLLEFLELQKENALCKMLEIEKTIAMVNSFGNSVRQSQSSTRNKEVYYKDLPCRLIITKELGNPVDEAIINKEYALFCQLLADHRLLNAFENGFFCVPVDGLYLPTKLFSVVEADENSNTSRLSEIQAGRFLCVNFNKYNEKQQLLKLNQHIIQNNIKPELYLQIFLKADLFDTELRYTEMQVLL